MVQFLEIRSEDQTDNEGEYNGEKNPSSNRCFYFNMWSLYDYGPVISGSHKSPFFAEESEGEGGVGYKENSSE